MYRQGDVLVEKVNKMPKNVEKIEIEKNRIVLAYGESTGHAHAIHSKNVIMIKCKETNAVFLIVQKECELVHEEHSTIKLPVGDYKVTRQREYSPERIRYVAD